MAKTLDPFYSTAVRNVAAKATAAKTTMTDATNAVLLATAGAEGSIVNSCKARTIGTGTVGDTVCYLFTSSDGGTTLHLKANVKHASTAVSTTNPAPVVDLGPSFDEPMQLSANEKLYCAISVANATGFEFEASLEDF